MDDTENDLFWHALNYRTAGTLEAEEMWKELQKCVERLIEVAKGDKAKIIALDQQ